MRLGYGGVFKVHGYSSAKLWLSEVVWDMVGFAYLKCELKIGLCDQSSLFLIESVISLLNSKAIS